MCLLSTWVKSTCALVVLARERTSSRRALSYETKLRIIDAALCAAGAREKGEIGWRK